MIRDQNGLEVPEEMAEIGYVIDAHGLDGEIRVRPLTDEPEDRFNTVRHRYSLVKLLSFLVGNAKGLTPLTKPYRSRG